MWTEDHGEPNTWPDRFEAPPNMEPKPAQPKPQNAEGENHKIHRHDLPGIFGPAQTRCHKGKSPLHEHDEDACQKNPCYVFSHNINVKFSRPAGSFSSMTFQIPKNQQKTGYPGNGKKQDQRQITKPALPQLR